MAEEGIAETLTLTCTFHKTSNIGHVEEGRHLAGKCEKAWITLNSLIESTAPPCWQVYGELPTNPTSRQGLLLWP